VLVCNAAKCCYGPVESTDATDIQNIIDVNIASTTQLVRVLLPRMRFRRMSNDNCGSRIVFIGSTASVAPGPSTAVYAASKSYLSSFAKVCQTHCSSIVSINCLFLALSHYAENYWQMALLYLWRIPDQ
jgi:uncharacterized protein